MEGVMITFTNGRLLIFLLVSGIFFTKSGFCSDPGPSLKFIENKNQWAADIHFTAKVPGGSMVIGPGKFQYYFVDENHIQELHDGLHDDDEDGVARDPHIAGHSVRATFVGSNSTSIPLPFGKSEEYYNYYLGSDPKKWASKAFAYTGVLYQNFYQEINLKVYSSGQHLKYDFVVAPYGDPSQILVQYEGADALTLENGNLFLKTPLGNIIEKRPVAYQFINGKKVDVPATYALQGNLLSFCFPQGYDLCYELVIDPLLIFSTFSGSTADNWGSSATPGEHGNLYSAGATTQSSGGKYPATVGAFQIAYGGLYDIGILKYDSVGSKLLYASYLGGSESESAHSLVMNSNEELVILGTTGSFDFPTTKGAIDRSFNGGVVAAHVFTYNSGCDIFVAKISKDGTQLLASTYLGGSKNDGLNPNSSSNRDVLLTKNYGDELRGDVVTDNAGNIFISSVTSSPDFPIVNGFQKKYKGGITDALVLKLDAQLQQILWSSYLGGIGADASHTLKLDRGGNIFIGGGTTSVDFPVTGGGNRTVMLGEADGWIAKLKGDGSAILHATFVGGSAFDQVYFLDINSSEQPYVYGQTNDFNFPTSPGVYKNPHSGQFIQKFSNNLSSLLFSTVFGSGRGVPDISPTAFLINDCNNLYMSGWGSGVLNKRINGWDTSTKNLPITRDAYQKTTSGNDFYFIVLTDDAAELLYATYLGGPNTITHVDGGTSRFDKNGIVYHAVCAGCNTDRLGPKSDFPTTKGAWSRVNRSANCNNAAFKFDLSSLKARLQTNSVKLNMPGLNVICIPDKIVFQNFSTGGEIFEWDLGDGTKVTKNDTSSITHQYKEKNQYVVKLKAIDRGTCKEIDSTSAIVIVNKSAAKVEKGGDLCGGDAYQLKASGGEVYEWSNALGELFSGLSSPVVTPADTARYFVKITESNGCILKDTVQVNVIPPITPDFQIEREGDCSDKPFIRVTNVTDSLNADDTFFFDFGDGQSTDHPGEDHDYEKEGVYQLKLVTTRKFCVYEKVATVPVFMLKLPNIITPGGTEGLNDTFTVQYGEREGMTPADYGYTVSLIVYNRWGKILFETDDYHYNWSGEGLAAGVYYYEVSIPEQATCKSWLQLVK
jgi:hypothetical protein